MKIEEFLKQSTEGASKVKLPGGIVGKISYILMAALGAIAVIGFSTKSEIFGFIALGVIPIIVLLPVWWLIRFAEKRPEVAILEGAEFLVYHQIELAQKGVGILPDAPPEPPEGTERLPSPQDIEVAMLPDPEPSEVSEPKRINRRKD